MSHQFRFISLGMNHMDSWGGSIAKANRNDDRLCGASLRSSEPAPRHGDRFHSEEEKTEEYGIKAVELSDYKNLKPLQDVA